MIIYDYIQITFGYFWLFHLMLLLVILSYFGYSSLFHLRLFSAIVILLAILCYFWLL
jgi:hypothetical protein